MWKRLKNGKMIWETPQPPITVTEQLRGIGVHDDAEGPAGEGAKGTPIQVKDSRRVKPEPGDMDGQGKGDQGGDQGDSPDSPDKGTEGSPEGDPAEGGGEGAEKDQPSPEGDQEQEEKDRQEKAKKDQAEKDRKEKEKKEKQQKCHYPSITITIEELKGCMVDRSKFVEKFEKVLTDRGMVPEDALMMRDELRLAANGQKVKDVFDTWIVIK